MGQLNLLVSRQIDCFSIDEIFLLVRSHLQLVLLLYNPDTVSRSFHNKDRSSINTQYAVRLVILFTVRLSLEPQPYGHGRGWQLDIDVLSFY
jgi:hypothetical protein